MVIVLPFGAINRTSGDPEAVRFTLAKMKGNTLDFSFSGLKTAVLYALHGKDAARGTPPPPGKLRADLAASFQRAVVDVLVRKAQMALRQTGQKDKAIEAFRAVIGLLERQRGGGAASDPSYREAATQLQALTTSP